MTTPEDAHARAELEQRRRRAASVRAAALLEEFVGAAGRSGLAPERLRVQGYGGRGSARGDRRGWYLRKDRTAAVGEDGRFYVLTAPLSVRDRVRGVRLVPEDPPLVLGAGGKDGSSVELVAALDRLLPGWRTR